MTHGRVRSRRPQPCRRQSTHRSGSTGSVRQTSPSPPTPAPPPLRSPAAPAAPTAPRRSPTFYPAPFSPRGADQRLRSSERPSRRAPRSGDAAARGAALQRRAQRHDARLQRRVCARVFDPLELRRLRRVGAPPTLRAGCQAPPAPPARGFHPGRRAAAGAAVPRVWAHPKPRDPKPWRGQPRVEPASFVEPFVLRPRNPGARCCTSTSSRTSALRGSSSGLGTATRRTRCRAATTSRRTGWPKSGQGRVPAAPASRPPSCPAWWWSSRRGTKGGGPRTAPSGVPGVPPPAAEPEPRACRPARRGRT